jgi:hypothetical protein
MIHGWINEVEDGRVWGVLVHKNGEEYGFDVALTDILEDQRGYIEPGALVCFPNGFLLVKKEIWTTQEMDQADAKAWHWAELFGTFQ